VTSTAQTETPATARGRDRRHQYPGRPGRIAPRFTEQEITELQQAAAAVGLTPTGFVAEASLGAARATERPAELSPLREALAQLQSELFEVHVAVGRIGTNLNQAVAAYQATGQVPAWLARAAHLCEQRMTRVDETITLVDRQLAKSQAKRGR
jgi:uncharacterized protein (DUF1778 family)